MRIERRDHPVDGALDHLGIVGLLDVVAPDTLEDFAKQVELRINVAFPLRLGYRAPLVLPERPANGQSQANARRCAEEKQGVLSHVASLLVGTAGPFGP